MRIVSVLLTPVDLNGVEISISSPHENAKTVKASAGPASSLFVQVKLLSHAVAVIYEVLSQCPICAISADLSCWPNDCAFVQSLSLKLFQLPNLPRKVLLTYLVPI